MIDFEDSKKVGIGAFKLVAQSIPILSALVTLISDTSSDARIENIERIVERLRHRINDFPALPRTVEKKRRLALFVESVLESAMKQYSDEKRDLLIDLLDRTFENNEELDKADYYLSVIRDLPIDALTVLSELKRSKLGKQSQFMLNNVADLVDKYEFDYLLALAKQLEQKNLILLRIDVSSFDHNNHRNTNVFWTQTTDEFLYWIKYKNEA